MFFSGISDEAGADLATQIRAHRELGWNYLELRTIEGVNLTDLDDAKFEAVYQAVNAAELKVSCFASQLGNWARPITGDFQKDVAELQRAIPRMTRMHTTFIRAMSWPNDPENPLPLAEWRKEAIRRMKILAEMARAGGITIVHENCSGYGGLGPRETLDLLAEVNNPSLKVVFDTGNFGAHAYESWDYYTALKPHITYIHIKDMKRAQEEIYTFPGAGDGSVPQIIADLIASGYQGGLSIEPHMKMVIHAGTKADGREQYQAYVEYGRRLMTLVSDIQKAKTEPKPSK